MHGKSRIWAAGALPGNCAFEKNRNRQPENNVWNYTKMYSASFWPSGAAIASFNAALADIHLSMINQWGEVQRDIIRRCTTAVVDAPAADGVDDGAVEPAGFAAAGDDQTFKPEDAPPEPDEQSMDDAVPPDDTGAGVGKAHKEHHGNAAMAILNNPALAAEAATRSADDAVDYEVHDDVADDIAVEIEREVRQELDPPNT